jgi:hypothetical protein
VPAKRLQLDPEGYFIILVRKGKENPLYVEHYQNNGRLLGSCKILIYRL